MKNMFLSLAVSAFILSACADTEEQEDTADVDIEIGDTEETPEEDIETNVEDIETNETEDESFEEAVEGIDLDAENPDEIPWDDIHLTQNQFDEFLTNFTNDSEPTEEEISIQSIDFDGNTIHIFIKNNEDNSDAAQFANSFFALFTDSFIRQFYLHSNYSDGEAHPLIIIEDVTHGIVSELDDFAEIEE